MALIELSDTVKQAIKTAGGDIRIVSVDQKVPSTTGVFHIKIRHLDVLLKYLLFKEGLQSSTPVNDYISQRNMRPENAEILAAYEKIREEFNQVRGVLLRNYEGFTENNLMHAACGSKRARMELVKLNPGGQYLNYLQTLQKVFDRMVRTEVDNPQVFGGINSEIFRGIEAILKNPRTIFMQRDAKKLAFCSDEFEGVYVLGLVGNRQVSGTADLTTGFKANPDKFLGGMDEIYRRH